MSKIITVAAALVGAGLLPATAQADMANCPAKLENSYSAHYYAVAKKFNRRTPGRNIRKWGVELRKSAKRDARPARCSELRESRRQLIRLKTPVRSHYGLLKRTAVPPSQPPSGVATASVAGTGAGGSSNPMVNPNCESSGNPQVVDPSGTYWGKYQFDYGTWVAHGGSPGSYGSASEAEQDQVAARVTYDAWPNC